MAKEHFLDRRNPFISPIQGFVNIQNCRIFTTKNPFAHALVPFHSAMVGGSTSSFIVASLFFEKVGPAVPITYTVNGKRYENLLRNQIISINQQRACLDKIIFMQDSAPLYIINC